MRLHELRVQRAPGLPAGVSIPLDAEAVVVHGPNAAGKSSVARALRAALWPESFDARWDAGLRIADFDLELDGEDARGPWTLRLRGGERVCLRQGAPAEPPLLPDAPWSSGYFLGLGELIQATPETEKAWADRIRRELLGGYDVEVVREAWEVRNRRPSEVAQLQKTRKEIQERRQALAKLVRMEEEEGSVRSALEEARAAERRRERVEQARERLRIQRELRERQEEQAGRPAVLQRLRPENGPELEDRVSLLQRHTGERVRAAEAQEAAGGALEAARAGLPEAPPPERLEVLAEEAGEARSLAGESAGLEEELAGLRARVEALREAGWGLVEGLPEGLAARIEDGLAALERARGRVEALRGRLSALAEAREDAAARLQQVERGLSVLRRWLRQPGALERGRRLRWGLLAAGVLSLPLLFLEPLLVAVPAMLLGAVLVLLWVQAAAPAAADPSSEWPQGLPALKDWDEAEVQRRLQELEDEKARLDAALAQERERVRCQAELEGAERELDRLDGQVKDLVRKAGLPELAEEGGILDLGVLQRRWNAFQETACRIQELEGRIGEKRRRIEALRQEILPVLEAAGIEAGETAEALAAGVRELRRRAEALAEAERTWRERTAALETAQKAEEDARTAFLDFGRRFGLPEDPEEALRAMAALQERLPAFRETQDRIQELAGDLRRLDRELEEDPELLELDEAGLERLDRRLVRQESEISRLEEAVIELEAARQNSGQQARELSDLQDRERELRERLAGYLEEGRRSLAGALLLDRILEEHRRDHQPASLERAARWFEDFTSGRYALGLAEDGAFFVEDRQEGGARRLPELSDGTRTQLLVALRAGAATAWEEGRERPPLVLDESLGNADPKRFEEVARCLLRLAREEERQILYFTAMPEDAARWREAAQIAGAEAPRVLDLAALLREGTAVEGEIPAVRPVRRRVPSPEGKSLSAYARELGVRPLDPWGPEAAVDLFWLLPDRLDLVQRTREEGWSTLGLWEAAAERPLGRAFGARSELERRARWLRAFLEHWRRGRSRPLTAEDLRRCLAEGGFKTSKAEDLESWRRQVGGGVQPFLQGLQAKEVSGLQTRIKNWIRDWLAAEGFLPEEEPLGLEAIRVRVAAEDASLKGDPDGRALQEALVGLWTRELEGGASAAGAPDREEEA